MFFICVSTPAYTHTMAISVFYFVLVFGGCSLGSCLKLREAQEQTPRNTQSDKHLALYQVIHNSSTTILFDKYINELHN